MANYGYHLARAEGRLISTWYNLLLPLIVRRRITTKRTIPIDVFSYSSARRLGEQVLSIRSFLTYAGKPNRFVVVSDGSHSPDDIDLLRRIDGCVAVESVPGPPVDSPASLGSYLRTHPTGKQLALIMSLPRGRPALYIDSDVLFFDAAPNLHEYLKPADTPAYYLQDCGFAGDERLLRDSDEKAKPVNTGVLLICRPLDWSHSIARFAGLQDEPIFFTNQTMTHLTMHANAAQPFHPEKFILRLDDQFVYRDRFAGPDVVLRHYVDPVRHKLWTSLAR